MMMWTRLANGGIGRFDAGDGGGRERPRGGWPAFGRTDPMSNRSRSLYCVLTAAGPRMAYGAAAFATAVNVAAGQGETGASSVVPEECVRPVSLAEGRMYERNDTLDERVDRRCGSVHYPGRGAVYFGFTLDRAAPVVVEMTSVDIDAWLILRSGTPPGGDLVRSRASRDPRPATR